MYRILLTLLVGLYASPLFATNLSTTVGEWIDPAIASKAPQVKGVLEVFGKTPIALHPEESNTEDYGFSTCPGTKFDWIVLSVLSGTKSKQKERIPLLDLGCGMGMNTVLCMFAGAKVDAVDLKHVITEGNKLIYKSTKKILGYNAKNSTDYYRAFPENVLTKAAPLCFETPHKFVLCKDLFHMMTESQIMKLGRQIFDNLVPDGALFVQVDTPFYNERCLVFYKARQGKVMCPGLGIYTKLRAVNQTTDLKSDPVAYDENVHKFLPGVKIPGRFNSDNTVDEEATYYHNVRNVFLLEDLSALFVRFGFRTTGAFYLDHQGVMLTDGKQPKVGTPSKACLLLSKPLGY